MHKPTGNTGKTQALLGVVLLAGLGGCTTKRTEVVLGIMTNMTACDGLAVVRLKAFDATQPGFPPLFTNDWDLRGQGCPVTQTPYDLPGSIGLFSQGGNSDRITITLEGLTDPNGGPILTRTSTFTLIKEQTVFMRMALVSSCVPKICGASETCIEGLCKPIPVGSGGTGMATMPLTLAGRAAAATAPTVDHILPAYQEGMETWVDCSSGTPFVNTFSRMAVPMHGTQCQPGEFCEEGTCYKDPKWNGQNPDGGTGQGPKAWLPVTVTPPNGVNLVGSYPEGNQAVWADNAILVWGGQDPAHNGAPLTQTLKWDPTANMLSIAAMDIGCDPTMMPTCRSLPEVGATTWDSKRHVMVTYRIDNVAGYPTGEIVEFDGTAWVNGRTLPFDERSATGLYPRARKHARIAYDPISDRTVLFGGVCVGMGGGCAGSVGCTDAALCDTWLWDGAARTWTQAMPQAHPSGRRDAQLVSDGQKVILFGGRSTDPSCTPNCTDTWEWDGAQSTWTPVTQTFTGNLLDGLLLFDSKGAQEIWMNFPGTSTANTYDIYGIPMMTWQVLTSFPSAPAIQNFSAAYEPPPNNTIWVYGGTTGQNAASSSPMYRVPLP